MNLKSFYLLSVLSVTGVVESFAQRSNTAEEAAENSSVGWHVKRNFQFSGLSLSDLADHLSTLSEKQIEVDDSVANIMIGEISVKNQSLHQLLELILESHDLAVEKTYQGRDYIITEKKPGVSLHLLDNIDGGGFAVLNFNDATPGQVLDYLKEIAKLNVVAPKFKNTKKLSISGGKEVYSVLNRIAQLENLSVYERDGVILFKTP